MVNYELQVFIQAVSYVQITIAVWSMDRKAKMYLIDIGLITLEIILKQLLWNNMEL